MFVEGPPFGRVRCADDAGIGGKVELFPSLSVMRCYILLSSEDVVQEEGRWIQGQTLFLQFGSGSNKGRSRKRNEVGDWGSVDMVGEKKERVPKLRKKNTNNNQPMERKWGRLQDDLAEGENTGGGLGSGAGVGGDVNGGGITFELKMSAGGTVLRGRGRIGKEVVTVQEWRVKSKSSVPLALY